MPNGTVKWFNNQKGYGFISQIEGPDVFAHYTAIAGEGFRTLKEGEEVEFEITDGPKGPQAANILRKGMTTVAASLEGEEKVEEAAEEIAGEAAAEVVEEAAAEVAAEAAAEVVEEAAAEVVEEAAAEVAAEAAEEVAAEAAAEVAAEAGDGAVSDVTDTVSPDDPEENLAEVAGEETGEEEEVVAEDEVVEEEDGNEDNS